MISTHAPAGGATYWEILFEQWDAFLLTPLREGRRTILFSICSALHISTHAPAGGATGDFELLTGSKYLFLLTPLREGRQEQSKDAARYATFLLTPLREGRLISFQLTPALQLVFLLTPLREGRRWLPSR